MKKRALTTNTFFGGAAILAASIAVVKVIGALYKIPLGRILGDVGFGHFNNAYAIYNLLLMISQAGLPVAMSKTISEANALGRRNQVSRVFRVPSPPSWCWASPAASSCSSLPSPWPTSRGTVWPPPRCG